MPQTPPVDLGILEAALIGYKRKIEDLEGRIAGMRGTSDGNPQRATDPQPKTSTKNRGPRSAAVRKRMADAQRKRWAAVKRKQKSGKE